MLAKERLANRQLVENQNKKIDRLEESLRKLEVEHEKIKGKYDTQSNLLKENSKEMKSLKNENANLSQMLQTQNDNIVNIQQKLETLENENIKHFEKTLNNQRKDVKNLKNFAMTVGKLHETLSDSYVREKIRTSIYLYNEDYTTDKDAKQWNGFVEQTIANQDLNGHCDYLHQMVNVLLRYKKTVYPK